MGDTLLDGVRVIELSTSVAAAYCGKVLAELGADVTKIEAPGTGDPARSYGPFLGDAPDLNSSAGYIYLNTGKRSATIDWMQSAGQYLVSQLAAGADLLLIDGNQRDFGCSGTVVEFVGTAHPEHKGWAVSDLVGYALGGYLYVDGAAERAPLKGGGRQPAHAAANYALMAVLAQRFADKGGRRGRRITVPEAECMATMHWYTTVMWTYAHLLKRRIGNRLDIAHPVSLYPCQDGWVAIGAGGNDAWRLVALAAGYPDLADDPRFAEGWSRLAHADEVDTIVREFTMGRTRADVLVTLQTLRVPCGYVSSPNDLLHDPQYVARGYWKTVEQPEIGPLQFPGAPFEAPGIAFAAKYAPRLGEHTEEILVELGVSADDQRRYRWDHVV